MRESSNTLPFFFTFNMTNPIDQALDTLYERVMEMPNKVLDIFNNFFGEERVDMQNFPSKEELRHSILRMFVVVIFQNADMMDRLSLEGFNRREKLVDIDFESLPTESAAAFTEAILSNPFVEFCKALMKGFILVHFPRTVVTNEHDRSTVVNHIYVKVPITIKGSENGLFTMNRSEYTVAEIYSDYMHSHASHIPTDNFQNFVSCCLGSGPLNNTQTNLSLGFDEDRWNMFCLELSKYVEVESIAGRPYNYLEKISFNTSRMGNIDRLFNSHTLHFPAPDRRSSLLVRNAIREFLSYYLEHNNLTFSYRNGVYSLGMPFIEYLIHLSNSFIEFVNNRPELANSGITNCNIIGDYVVRNGELYQKSIDIDYYISTYREYVGKEVCTFKGRPVTVTITDLERADNNTVNDAKLINISLASYLLNRILRTINYRYGRNQENPYSTSGKVRYKV